MTDDTPDAALALFKVVRVSNYASQTYAESVLAEKLSEREADAVCEAMQSCHINGSPDWYAVKPQNYRLWRGMAEFV